MSAWLPDDSGMPGMPRATSSHMAATILLSLGLPFLTHSERRASVPAFVPNSSEDQEAGSLPSPRLASLLCIPPARPSFWATKRPRGKGTHWLGKEVSGMSGLPVINGAQRATCFHNPDAYLFFLEEISKKWNRASSSQRTWHSTSERAKGPADPLRLLQSQETESIPGYSLGRHQGPLPLQTRPCPGLRGSPSPAPLQEASLLLCSFLPAHLPRRREGFVVQREAGRAADAAAPLLAEQKHPLHLGAPASELFVCLC